jgi:hypothetical protein
MYKLRGWIDEDKINWEIVLRQKKAFQMSKKYIDKMFEQLIVPEPWQQSGIYEREDIVPVLKKYPHKIHWPCLCQNRSPEAIALLQENVDKINWRRLADNPSAIPILEKHLDMLFLDDVSFHYLCINTNPDVIPLIEKILEQAPEKIDWEYLARNPNAMPIIKKNLDKIFGNDRVFHNFLRDNTHPEAIRIIEQNLDKFDELSWYSLQHNTSAIPILEKNMDKIYLDWYNLVKNPNALHLIEQYMDMDNHSPLYLLVYPHTIHLADRIEESRFRNYNEICWRFVYDHMPAYNSPIQKKVISFIEKYADKAADFRKLSGIANAIHILKKNMDKVDWSNMSHNPAAIHILEKNQHKIDWNSLSYNSEIFDYSYEYLQERCNIYKEELIQRAMSPKKLQRYIDEGYDMEEFLEFI